MTPSELRVLECVMRLADRGETVTVRAICKMLDWKGTFFAWRILERLCTLELLTCERENGVMLGGTIRPAVRFIPREMLLCES